MKNLKYILAFVLLCTVFLSCEDNNKYEGAPRVKFDKAQGNFFVQPDVVSTTDVDVQLISKPLDKDVEVQITVVSDETTARAGLDYAIPSKVTIPAGKNMGKFTVTGFFDGVSQGDGIKILTLKVIGPNGAPAVTTFGADKMKITMRKLCPFVADELAGNYDVVDISQFDGAKTTYSVSVTKKSEEGKISKFEVIGLYEEDIPVEFVVDNTDPINVKVNIPRQKYFVHNKYGQVYIADMETGSLVFCDKVIKTNYIVDCAAGIFEKATSVWTKKK